MMLPRTWTRSLVTSWLATALLAILASSIQAETFFYTGPFGGDFFNEGFWNSESNGSGHTPTAGTIEPDIGFTHQLIIDGDNVTATGGDGFALDVGAGGSLSLLAGSDLQVGNPFLNAQFELSTGASLNLVDAALKVDDDILLWGTSNFSGGTVQSDADDIEFRGGPVAISGTSFSIGDSIILETELTPSAGNSITGASFTAGGRIGIRGFNTTVTDTSFTAASDLENVFTTDLDDATGTLTLLGNSSLAVDQLQEGVKLRVGGSSTATLANAPTPDEATWFTQSSTVTLDSPDASLVLENAQLPNLLADFDHDLDVDGEDFLIWQRGFGLTEQIDNSQGDANGDGVVDALDLQEWQSAYDAPSDTISTTKVINGLTGLSYAANPNDWNVTNWNGIDAVTLQIQPVAAATGEATTAVPEPHTLLLASLLAGSLFACRTRHG